MHVHVDVEKVFKQRFPYPMPMLNYSNTDRKRIGRLSQRWYGLHYLLGFIFWVLIAVGFMFIFQWLNAQLYRHLGSGKIWFSQLEAPFLIPGLFIGLPLGVITALYSIRLFHPFEYRSIQDLLNTRLEYDGIASWAWLLRPMSICCAIALAIVSWCYVSVSDKGIDIKNAYSFTETHYDFEEVQSIKHYTSTLSRDGELNHYDHYRLYFVTGKDLIKTAPYIDHRTCIEVIAKKGRIPIAADSVYRY